MNSFVSTIVPEAWLFRCVAFSYAKRRQSPVERANSYPNKSYLDKFVISDNGGSDQTWRSSFSTLPNKAMSNTKLIIVLKYFPTKEECIRINLWRWKYLNMKVRNPIARGSDHLYPPSKNHSVTKGSRCTRFPPVYTSAGRRGDRKRRDKNKTYGFFFFYLHLFVIFSSDDTRFPVTGPDGHVCVS